MRISYADDEDFPGQFNLWQGNCQRSIDGKNGQAALRELEAALLALPEKRLIHGELQDSEGGVCAIGALAKYRNVEVKSDPEEMEEVGVELGMPRMVAWKVVALNDVGLESYYDTLTGKFKCFTPEQRYERVLKWVREQIKTQSEIGAA